MHYCSSRNSIQIQEGTIFLTDQIYQHLLNLKALKLDLEIIALVLKLVTNLSYREVKM